MTNEPNPYQAPEPVNERGDRGLNRMPEPTGVGVGLEQSLGIAHYATMVMQIASIVLILLFCVELLSASGRHLVEVLARMVFAAGTVWLAWYARRRLEQKRRSGRWLVLGCALTLSVAVGPIGNSLGGAIWNLMRQMQS